MRYEEETGKLYWLPRRRELFRTAWHCNAWNSNFAGKEAFTAMTKCGHKAGAIFRKKYNAHRVVWLLATGAWPKNEIDHIDGDKTNNRMSNLRDVTALVNRRNVGRSKGNTSGMGGVSWDKFRMKWKATTSVKGQQIQLGRFDTFEEAAAAKRKSNRSLGFTERHGL